MLYGMFVVGVEHFDCAVWLYLRFALADAAALPLVFPDDFPLSAIDAVDADEVGLPAGRLRASVSAILLLPADQESSTRYAVIH